METYLEDNDKDLCIGYSDCMMEQCNNWICTLEINEREIFDDNIAWCPGSYINWSCGYEEVIDTEISNDLYIKIQNEIVENANDNIVASQKFTKIFGNKWSHSEALSNPRMFMWNSAKKNLLLPMQIYLTDPLNSNKRIDFFQWLFSIKIDIEKGISENYKISHIDFSDIEAQRNKECEKYSQNQESTCRLLLDWSEYCSPVKKYNYVPEFCFADTNISQYKTDRAYQFRNDYVKRALWIGDTAISISDNKMMTTDLESGKKYDTVNMK
jgi:hypothetical protein